MQKTDQLTSVILVIICVDIAVNADINCRSAPVRQNPCPRCGLFFVFFLRVSRQFLSTKTTTGQRHDFTSKLESTKFMKSSSTAFAASSLSGCRPHFLPPWPEGKVMSLWHSNLDIFSCLRCILGHTCDLTWMGRVCVIILVHLVSGQAVPANCRADFCKVGSRQSLIRFSLRSHQVCECCSRRGMGHALNEGGRGLYLRHQGS